jgi:hypothetical protein
VPAAGHNPLSRVILCLILVPSSMTPTLVLQCLEWVDENCLMSSYAEVGTVYLPSVTSAWEDHVTQSFTYNSQHWDEQCTREQGPTFPYLWVRVVWYDNMHSTLSVHAIIGWRGGYALNASLISSTAIVRMSNTVSLVEHGNPPDRYLKTHDVISWLWKVSLTGISHGMLSNFAMQRTAPAILGMCHANVGRLLNSACVLRVLCMLLPICVLILCCNEQIQVARASLLVASWRISTSTALAGNCSASSHCVLWWHPNDVQ